MFLKSRTIWLKALQKPRDLSTSACLNFKFKLTEEMSKEFEQKQLEKLKEKEAKKPKPALHTIENSIIMGRVSSERYQNVIKVAIPKHRFNEHLVMYVRENDNILAYDKDNNCKPGDWILLRNTPELPDKKVTHTVERVIHSYGKYIDPITGRRSLGLYYDDDMERLEKIKVDL